MGFGRAARTRLFRLIKHAKWGARAATPIPPPPPRWQPIAALLLLSNWYIEKIRAYKAAFR